MSDELSSDQNHSAKGPPPRSDEAKVAPKAVVNRLSLYLRELQRIEQSGKETVSSSQLGKLLGFTDAQVRKDLAYFGQFGHPGVGYRCAELVAAIRRILGTDREWVVAIVGVGNLGRALLGYKGFRPQGFRVAAAFDSDPSKVGMSFGGVAVEPTTALETTVRERGVTLGLIATAAEAAQETADRLVSAGVVGILNFAPMTLSLPPGVSLVGVDLATELEQLSFSVANSQAAVATEQSDPGPGVAR
ncbi:Redox-sensing transcriptional repressor Rex [Botrimarina colliarenosi]|uniref:Redox-sensing transcriptional repressor Rex n=1 Tax=Botrimarina colliarenosi TaxID=2528001 RepID=A0A5C6A7E8_9BACT|nr:redox-sensing transcriptional repressor Rex [Botrimarina colliarenosi]TWT95245.1 Redox-sensing transcriptional repressor Rex [Botrimarina colliarenosi]